MEDGGGRLWILTNDFQLIRIIGSKVKVFSEETGCQRNIFLAWCADRATISGLVLLPAWFASRETNSRYTSPCPNRQRPDTGCRATDGKIWMAGGDLLTTWDGSQFSAGCAQIHGRQPGIAGIAVHQRRSVDRNREGPSALYRWRRETLHIQRRLADDPILCLSSGRDGTVWVGTRSGFSRVRKGSIETTVTATVSRKIRCIGSLRCEGSLWVATKNGLNQFLEGAATRYSSAEGLPSNNPGPVFQTTKAPSGRVRWTVAQSILRQWLYASESFCETTGFRPRGGQ